MNPWKRAPASAPLTDLQELLDWTPDTKPFQNLLRATVQLSQVAASTLLLNDAVCVCILHAASFCNKAWTAYNFWNA